MTTIPRLAESLQRVLGQRADEIGRETGFVQRESKVGGAEFSQIMVFGWMAKPEGSLSELSQTAASLGVQVSPQGIDERFSAASAELMRRLLLEAVGEMVEAEPVAIPILQRFEGVGLLDSSVILLPDELAEQWSGCGPTTGKAALKIMVEWDWLSGKLDLQLLAGRTHDQNNDLATRLPAAGYLRLGDLGFFNLKHFGRMTQAGAYWLSRLKAGTTLFPASQTQATSITQLLGTVSSSEIELDLCLGQDLRLVCRLVARRLPHSQADQRLRKLYQEAQREGRTPSSDQITLAQWSVLITNVPTALLSLPEAFVLYRLRWQIELLFKLWKTEACLDVSRSLNPSRILTELFAKLLGVLIQHWLILLGCWHCPFRSLTKAAQTIRKFAFALALTFAAPLLFSLVLSAIQFALSACRLNPRHTHPNTYQRLLALA
jgi:hypothetical protein